MLKVIPCRIPDVLLLEPDVFTDERGFLYESFSARTFQAVTGLDVQFVQDNHSKSGRGVLRGLHYQIAPYAQGKLLRVIQGTVFDVAIDIRTDSVSYGQSVGQVLNAEEKQQLWIPPGFAHGFLVLSETAELLYKTTDYYAPEQERCIRWDDPTLAIPWPRSIAPIVSAKDAAGSLFRA